MTVVDIRGKIRKNWPTLHVAGKYWAVTLPVTSERKPWKDAPFVCITHQPTGCKAAEVYREDARRIANRFAKLFGNARTVRGVMRKHAALPASQKLWIQRLRYWTAKKEGK